MRNGSTMIVVILVINTTVSSGAPDQPSITSPFAGSGTYTYNSRPFIQIYAYDVNYEINDVYVEIRYYGSYVTSYYAHDSAAIRDSFDPLPANDGGAYIRHRLQYTLFETLYDYSISVKVYNDQATLRESPYSNAVQFKYKSSGLPSVGGVGTPVLASTFNAIKNEIDALCNYRGGIYHYWGGSWPLVVGDAVRADDINEIKSNVEVLIDEVTGSIPTLNRVSSGDPIQRQDLTQFIDLLNLP